MPYTPTPPATTAAGSESLETLPVTLRPAPALLKYYALTSVFAGPFFFIPLIVLGLRYRTIRYALDDDGLSMRWGALFRREVSLNYGRIQDIHLSSNVIERWLGLGKIQIQTASASAKAEMTLEGLPDLEGVRDFLYSRMRGAAEGPTADRPTAGGGRPPGVPAQDADALAAVLRDVAGELRALREELATRPPRA